jgi:hypothetical protein
MIQLKNKESMFDEFKFVIMASEKNSYQGYDKLYINDSDIVCTDGHRLHLYKTDAIFENGVYEIIKNTKSEIILNKIESSIPFVNYKSVIPDITGKEADLEFDSIRITKDACLALYRIIKHCDICLNIDFIKDACSHNASFFYATGQLNQVLFKFHNETCLAVIMPLRMNK